MKSQSSNMHNYDEQGHDNLFSSGLTSMLTRWGFYMVESDEYSLTGVLTSSPYTDDRRYGKPGEDQTITQCCFMLGHSLRRWPYVKAALNHGMLFVGTSLFYINCPLAVCPVN